MCRRKQQYNYEPPRYQMVQLSYRLPVSGIVPAPKPAQFVQLTPVSMPVVINPYVTESQPLAIYDENYDHY